MPAGRAAAETCRFSAPGQESLIVVSAGCRLHGDRPLLGLPVSHAPGHHYPASREAGGLEDHESVHLHFRARQLAGVSGKGSGSEVGGGATAGPIGGVAGRDGGGRQRPGNPSPVRTGSGLSHAAQHVGEVGLLSARRVEASPLSAEVGEASEVRVSMTSPWRGALAELQRLGFQLLRSGAGPCWPEVSQRLRLTEVEEGGGDGGAGVGFG